MKQRTEAKEQINLLELIPVRTVKWEEGENEEVRLLKPKFKNAFLVKHLLPRLRRPHYKIKLDPVGSHFWKKCDGTTSVKTLGHLLHNEFGEEIEPLYDRLSLFLQHLERNGFIEYKNKPKEKHPEQITFQKE